MAHIPEVQLFDIGDAPILSATFRDENDTLTDPTTVEFKVKDPNGITTTTTSPDAAITNPSVGVWKLQMAVLSASGPFYWRAAGTAGLVAAAEDRFVVRPSQF